MNPRGENRRLRIFLAASAENEKRSKWFKKTTSEPKLCSHEPKGGKPTAPHLFSHFRHLRNFKNHPRNCSKHLVSRFIQTDSMFSRDLDGPCATPPPLERCAKITSQGPAPKASHPLQNTKIQNRKIDKNDPRENF